jgi:hypothetical protein
MQGPLLQAPFRALFMAWGKTLVSHQYLDSCHQVREIVHNFVTHPLQKTCLGLENENVCSGIPFPYRTASEEARELTRNHSSGV